MPKVSKKLYLKLFSPNRNELVCVKTVRVTG